MEITFKVIGIIILVQIVVILSIWIKHLFYEIFRGFWEEQTHYWKKQYDKLEYDYKNLKNEYRKLWGKVNENNGNKRTED